MRDTDFSSQPHGSILWIPAVCIRWTQDGVNAALRFKDQTSVIDALMYLWKNRYTYSNDIPEITVAIDRECNLLAETGNRRLVLFRLLQALNHQTVWVKCRSSTKHIRSSAIPHHFTTQVGGLGIFLNRGPPP